MEVNRDAGRKIDTDSVLKRQILRSRVLLISFTIFMVSLTLVVFLGSEYLENNKYISHAIFVFLYLSGLTYNIFLGLCATSASSSVITWVGLNIIFSPFSWLVTMPMMYSKMRGVITERKALISSYN